MNIRKMISDDIAGCADIFCSVYNNELWQCRWSKETAVEYLTDFFNMSKFVEEMFVKPELQRKGYGSMLLSGVEEYIKEKGLAGITLSTNKYAPAPHFYRKNGFVDCEHVLFMCKEM